MNSRRAKAASSAKKTSREVMHALFPLEAEQDMGFMKDASESVETSGQRPMSTRTSITRLSVDQIAPEEWKKRAPRGRPQRANEEAMRLCY